MLCRHGKPHSLVTLNESTKCMLGKSLIKSKSYRREVTRELSSQVRALGRYLKDEPVLVFHHVLKEGVKRCLKSL